MISANVVIGLDVLFREFVTPFPNGALMAMAPLLAHCAVHFVCLLSSAEDLSEPRGTYGQCIEVKQSGVS